MTDDDLFKLRQYIEELRDCAKEPNRGQVRVAGAGPTIEAAIDAAVKNLERGKA